ncbi:MAG: demethoxyubiquinone hydroxylase family protein [Hyphomonadaceae bacterium]
MTAHSPTGETPKERREEMLRVDHAGEYGAVAIYRGQLAVFGRRPGHERMVEQLEEMERQEQDHLAAFNRLLSSGGVRPTLLTPFWNAAGFALGAATALLGEKAAHACTEAVETVIGEHYGDQIDELEKAGDADLAGSLTKFRDDEIAHRDLATEEGAAQAPGYPLLSAAIKLGCRIAIKVAEKV